MVAVSDPSLRTLECRHRFFLIVNLSPPISSRYPSSLLLYATSPLSPASSPLDLGHCTKAVNRFARFGERLLVSGDEREKRNDFPGPGRHSEDAVAASIQGFVGVSHILGLGFCIVVGVTGGHAPWDAKSSVDRLFCFSRVYVLNYHDT